MANLGTKHEVYVVYAVKLLHKLCHCLPCPLTVVIFCGLVHASVGQETLLHAIGTHILCEKLLFTHGVCVLVSELAERVRIFLQTKLCGELQIVGWAQFCVKNCHDRAVTTLGVGVDSLLEYVEVE